MNRTDLSANSYYESNYVIRPGTKCSVHVLYSLSSVINFDSDIDNILEVDGYVEISSLSFSKTIDFTTISLTYSNDLLTSYVSIPASSQNTIDMYIEKYVVQDEEVVSFSAFDNKKYFNYIEEKDGYIVPYTIIEFTYPENAVTINKVTITPIIEKRGIELKDGIEYRLDSQGILSFDNKQEIILNQGLKIKKIHYTLYNKTYKEKNGEFVFVEYIDNKWQDGYTEANGLLFYEFYIFVTTNKALCVFDMFGNLSIPIIEDTFIKNGGDLTTDQFDNLYITYKNRILKYHIRHDMALISRSEKRIYFRENNPRFNIQFK